MLWHKYVQGRAIPVSVFPDTVKLRESLANYAITLTWDYGVQLLHAAAAVRERDKHN